MITGWRIFICALLIFPVDLCAQKAAPKQITDPFGRANPRSTVTRFLETCDSRNYGRAAQYLDLRGLTPRRRAQDGPQLARQLEAILNSDSRFNVLQISESADTPSPLDVATISRNGETFPIALERVELQPGTSVWLFSSSTILAIPALSPPPTTQSAIEARLPRFLVSIHFLETPIWKWITLILVAILVFFLFRLSGHALVFILKKFEAHVKRRRLWLWLQALLQPWLIFLSAMVFGVAEQFIDPSAISRLYIGRAILLVVVWSFAWCAINLVDLFLLHLDSRLTARQRVVSRSLIYLGRRLTKVIIAVVAAIVILNNWGYNMTTIIAGLGVGGIAVALAAQSTIANVFGGVSVIGDSPVMVGDFGNFGGVIGTVEDIGMRSTRIRTLNRTLMSIPNSSFAGMNLENYAVRDKILFNPTLQIKRSTPKDKLRQLMTALEDLLKKDKRIEVVPSPIRVSNLTSASFTLEIFSYALTADIDEFYKIQAELFLAIDDAITAAGVELA